MSNVLKYVDPLFGEISSNKPFPMVLFNDLTKVAEILAGDDYYFQLIRLIRHCGGVLDAVDSTSCPSLYLLLNALPVDKINLVYIGKRTDLNDAVKATIDCTIFFADGILRVSAQWCAYKEIRAREIVDSLVEPLMECGLITRTYVKHDSGDVERLSSSKDEAANILFSLSGYPSMRLE